MSSRWMVGAIGAVIGVGIGVGIGLGAEARTASAQEPRFTECQAVTMPLGAPGDLHGGRPGQTVRIPSGWRVLGGTSTSGSEPVLIACR